MYHNLSLIIIIYYLFLKSSDYDVDGGRDLDIFDINEGMQRGEKAEDSRSQSLEIVTQIFSACCLHSGGAGPCGRRHRDG